MANFLVTSCGRRGALVKILQTVTRSIGTGRVYAADASPLTAAGYLADHFHLVPLVSDERFISDLLEICAYRRITHLIPTIDTELPVLAANVDRFAKLGTTVWVSSPSAIEVAFDKRKTHVLLTENGLPRVTQVDLKEATSIWTSRGLIAKPSRGSSSHGLRRITAPAELANLDPSLDYVVETIAPGVEYTVDVLVTQDGVCHAPIPRRRLEVRAGEVSKGRTELVPELMDLAVAVVNALPGAFGVLNVQAFFDSDSGEMNVIEINPRFGGGFPLSWEAGGRYPLWLHNHLSGESSIPDAPSLIDGLTMLRYDDAVFVQPSNRLIGG